MFAIPTIRPWILPNALLWHAYKAGENKHTIFLFKQWNMNLRRSLN